MRNVQLSAGSRELFLKVVMRLFCKQQTTTLVTLQSILNVGLLARLVAGAYRHLLVK